MILKILTRHTPSYQNLIEYILQEGKSKDGQPEIITHNLRSKDIKGYVNEFMQNEVLRQHPRKGNILLYHEILSFSKFDKQDISNEKLKDIARQYIKQRGIEGVYVGAIHNDKNHKHIHFATSGVAFRTGNAFRLSREELNELKISMQEYHKAKYPELENSICEHGARKQYLTNKEYHLAQRTNRNTIKQEIQQTIDTCLQQSSTQQQFLTLLQEAGLHHYERKRIPQGITYDNYKFRFTRLGVDLQQLPITTKDMKKEKDLLDEIWQLREGKNNPNREQSLLDEAYIQKNEIELAEINQRLDKLYEQKDTLYLQLQGIDTGTGNPELNQKLDLLIQEEARLLSQAEELSLDMEADRLHVFNDKGMVETYATASDMTEFAQDLEEKHQALIDNNEIEVEEDIDEDRDEKEVTDELEELREEEREADEYDRYTEY